MPTNIANQTEFSSVLYDSLFGLVIFYSLDSFLEINEVEPFIFYAFTNIILIHWWLLFSAASDTFKETRRSALFIFFNIFYIILLEFMILFSKTFQYRTSALFLASVFVLDLIWVAMVKYMHEWKTSDKEELKKIRLELKNIFKTDVLTILPLLALLAISFYISAIWFVIFYIAIYLFYIFLTFYFKIIDLKFF